jgi:hypothetical protein
VKDNQYYNIKDNNAKQYIYTFGEQDSEIILDSVTVSDSVSISEEDVMEQTDNRITLKAKIKQILLNVKEYFTFKGGGFVSGLPDTPLPLFPNKVEYQSSTKQDAYYDRNQAILLAAIMAQKAGYTVGVIDDEEWPIVYIELPTGQVSWHLPKAEIITFLPKYAGEWDKHTVEEKRGRIKEFLNWYT